MTLRRILNFAAALAAVAAAAAVCVVAAAFAVYALARPWIGPAGASAVVAAVFALAAAALAAVATRKAAPGEDEAPDDASALERLIGLAKARPLMAAGVAAAVVTLVLRNPAILSAVLSAAIAGGAAKPGKPQP